MHVYGSAAWSAPHLDEAVGAQQLRIAVHRMVAVGPVEDQFFVRPSNVAMLLSYLRMLGPRRVVRKVRSRRREEARNDAWVAVGVGTLPEGDHVWFVVPSGPVAADRLVLHQALVFPAAPDELDGVAPGHLVPRAGATIWASLDEPARAELQALAGWSPYQGGAPTLSPALCGAVRHLVGAPPSAVAVLAPPPDPGPVRERIEAASAPASGGPGFHLFGYGQYAKTQVVPNLGARLRLECVHEINPLQIGPVSGTDDHGWDCSGWPRPGEEIRNAVLAGYHHTHAPMAVELIERGARHVVVEKPIASNHEQLDALLDAMARHPEARVHVAFQRRHSPFNEPLRADLGGGPVSMAATVYEVPLPARHWYRWPVVGNAVVSNGCHWIDHFLFLNDYEAVVGLGASSLSSQTVLTIELANGASCSISLRHEGAPRRGVRDRCTFWHGDATVVIDDMRTYVAERGFRQLRRRRIHPYRSLEAMYEEFGRRIELDLPGDDVRRVRASAAATLDLARLVDDGA